MPAYTSGIPKSGMLEIGVALVLHDQLTTGMAAADKEVRRLYNQAKNGVIANLQAAASIGQMGENLFGGMISAISNATEEATKYLDTMTTVYAITEATNEQSKALQETAKKVGYQSIFSIPEVASGMKYLAMAGATADEIHSMIGAATNVAGATGLALGGKGGAADIITNVMRTYTESGLSAEEVGDIMTKAALRSNMSMSDMAASIRYASADLTNLKYTLGETSAMIGTLGNMGIQGSMAGTALANMARYLGKSISDASYKGHKALQNIGLSSQDLTDAQGNLLEIDKILVKIRDATASMNSIERANIYNQIFGVRGNRAATALTRDLEGYRNLLNEIADSSGYAMDIMDRRMNTLFGTLERFNEAITNLKTIWTQSMEPVLKPLIKTATTWLNGLGNILQMKVMGPIIGFFSVAIPLSGRFFSSLVKWRAIFLLMTRTDTLVTLRNAWSVLTGGWSVATANANQYLNKLRVIQAQQMTLAKTTAAANAMQMAPVVVNRGGITYTGTPTPNGKGRHVFRDDKTGRFVSRNDPRVTSNFGDVLTGAAIGKAASNTGKGIKALTSVGRGLAGVGKGIFNLMGGWWGLAITGISVGLPYLIGSINSRSQAEKQNREAMKESTKATNWNTAALGTLAAKFDTKEEADAAGKTLNLEEEIRLLNNSIKDWIKRIDNKEYKDLNLKIVTPSGEVIQSTTFEDFTKQESFSLGVK